MTSYYDTIDHHALCLNELISNVFQQNSSYYRLTATMLERTASIFPTVCGKQLSNIDGKRLRYSLLKAD